MKYMLLIYGDESQREQMSEAERAAEMPKWMDYTMDLQTSGALIAGDALHTTASATTVRAQLVTDGPFAETKEALGGYYLIEAAGLDEAIEWAKRCPGAAGGSIEVRPVMEMPMPEAQ